MCHSLLKNATGNGTQAVPYKYILFLLGAVSFILRQPLLYIRIYLFVI